MPFFILIWPLIICYRLWNSKWSMISFQTPTFFLNVLDNLYMDFKLSLQPPFGLSQIVIVHEISPLVSFSSWFSFRLVKQQNVNFPIGFGGFTRTSPKPSRMFHFSHSTRTISQRWKIVSEERRMFIHSFVDSTFKIGFNVSSNCCKQ
jgi:hypothetical protein